MENVSELGAIREHSFLEVPWLYVRNDLFQGDEWSICFWGTYVVIITTLVVFNVALMVLDLAQWPRFLLKYKIQKELVDHGKLYRCFPLIIFNWTVVQLTFNYIAIGLALKWRLISYKSELPSWFECLWQIIICVLVEETAFYYSHRLGHLPYLYRRVHKIHHEWTAPTGPAAMYAHPFEHLISNSLPAALGPFLCGAHVTVAWFWYFYLLQSTTIAHSGYHFPFAAPNEAHDYHHVAFNQCYGAIGLLDWLHGTDVQFRKTKQFRRNRMFFGFQPIKEKIP